MRKLLLAFLFPLVAFGQGTPSLRFNTVADMVARPIPTVNNSLTAFVAGRVTANDGGGGLFFFTPASASTTNLGTVFPSTGVAGRWFRTYSGAVNVRWFGALGDNAADDYQKITNAVAVSDSVFFPAGTYLTSDEIIPGTGNVLFGEGQTKSVLKATAAFDVSKIVVKFTNSNGELRGLTIDGNNRATHCVSPRASVSNVRVIDCEIKNGVAAGYEAVENGSNLLVESCYIHNNSGPGIFLFSGIGQSRIANNFVSECASYHILIDGGTTGGTTVPCTNNVIEGNTIRSLTATGWGIGVEGSRNNVVTGNTIKLAATTYGILVDNDNTTDGLSSYDNIVHGNFIDISTTGMRIGGERNQILNNRIVAGDMGIVLDNAGSSTNIIQNILVSGNQISGLSTSGNKTGIYCPSANDTKISGNYIMGAGLYGIRLDGRRGLEITSNLIINSQREGIFSSGANLTNVWITGNTVLNSGIAAAATYAGIGLNASGSATPSINGLRVADNIIDDYQAVPTTKTGVEILGLTGKITNMQAGRNRVLVGTFPPASYGLSDPMNGDNYVQSLTGGAIDIDASKGDYVTINATSAVTVNAPSKYVRGGLLYIDVLQDGTGGHNVTWNAVFVQNWTDLGNSASARSSIMFSFNGTNWIQIGRQKDYGHIAATRSLNVGASALTQDPGANNAVIGGLLGVGKVPSVTLDVENASSAEAIFKTTAGNNPGKITLRDAANRTLVLISPNNIGAGNAQVGTSTGHPMALIANNTEHWLLTSAGNLEGQAVANGIKFKEGSNARMGRSALVNGTVTVANTSVTASTEIFLTRRIQAGTTVGILSVGTVTAATSFVINSLDLAGALSADDDSTVNWLLVEPSP